MRVCLFGGSFDPPHICHLMAAVWALQTRPIDEVWWVPTHQHAFGKQLRSFRQRQSMVEAVIEPLASTMRVEAIEHELGGVSRTIDTVSVLLERHPGHEFSLLMGADLVDELPSWKDADRLLETVDVHVIGREGYQSPAVHDLRLPDISSTALRAAIADGNRAFYRPRMSAAVVEMIEEHGWYAG